MDEMHRCGVPISFERRCPGKSAFKVGIPALPDAVYAGFGLLNLLFPDNGERFHAQTDFRWVFAWE